MAETDRTTQEFQPEVRVYEYIVPGAAVRPPRIVYPGMMPLYQPVTPAQRLLHRWAQRRYGNR